MPHDGEKAHTEKDQWRELPRVLEMLEQEELDEHADHSDHEDHEDSAPRDSDDRVRHRRLISDTSRPGIRG